MTFVFKDDIVTRLLISRDYDRVLYHAQYKKVQYLLQPYYIWVNILLYQYIEKVYENSYARVRLGLDVNISCRMRRI